jgi:hypothetical protein
MKKSLRWVSAIAGILLLCIAAWTVPGLFDVRSRQARQATQTMMKVLEQNPEAPTPDYLNPGFDECWAVLQGKMIQYHGKYRIIGGSSYLLSFPWETVPAHPPMNTVSVEFGNEFELVSLTYLGGDFLFDCYTDMADAK